MPALKYYDLSSGTYKYVTGGMSQVAADARYQQKNVFANAAARNAAIPSPTEGDECWLLDLHQRQAYFNGYWAPIGGVMPFGYAQFPGGSLSPGVGRIGLTPSVSSLRGGMISVSSGSILVLPYQGQYTITARIGFAGATATDDLQVILGSEAGQWSYTGGSRSSRTGGSGIMSVTAETVPLPANQQVGLWYWCSPTRTMDWATIAITYTGMTY